MVGKLTVANQHTRNSYLRFSDKESRRNHDPGPWGSVDVENAAFNWRRRADLEGVKLSNLSWSRFGCTEGTIDDSGAEKIIFSTLPKARENHKLKTRAMVISRIVVLHIHETMGDTDTDEPQGCGFDIRLSLAVSLNGASP